ncbi:hypothetical protein [Pantanalinema sp. GBBB05]|uniref:hypothetical protein n=1 Tax=Pantanalinema sp. GBBB05 TaxID=2604139 RepID=UPI001D523C14|nr:hypothetical protein [Pantanalinema sp. GBBB05]
MAKTTAKEASNASEFNPVTSKATSNLEVELSNLEVKPSDSASGSEPRSTGYSFNALGKELNTSNHTARTWFDAVVEIYGDRYEELFFEKTRNVSELGLEECKRLQRACARQVPVMDEVTGLPRLVKNHDRVDLEAYKTRRRIELSLTDSSFKMPTLNQESSSLVLADPPQPEEIEGELVDEELESDNQLAIAAIADHLEAFGSQYKQNLRSYAKRLKLEAAAAFIEELSDTSDMDTILDGVKPQAKKSRRKSAS